MENNQPRINLREPHDPFKNPPEEKIPSTNYEQKKYQKVKIIKLFAVCGIVLEPNSEIKIYNKEKYLLKIYYKGEELNTFLRFDEMIKFYKERENFHIIEPALYSMEIFLASLVKTKFAILI